MQPLQSPLLSICVPTYNRQFLLQRNVEFHLEAFRTIGIPFEIVIVDDCSTDGTAQYLEEISENPEISAFRRVKNSGFVSNYAFAMRRARGKYATFLGDDDLLIPEKVIEYVRIMEEDPALGVVQAPWMLVDERGGVSRNAGPFYKVPGGAIRHERGNFRSLLDMIFDSHVFPEFMIIRRDVLSRSISKATPFIFWAFFYTGRALEQADMLFLAEPFARVTAASDDPRLQQGNHECMFEWDKYRGGLEYLASKTMRKQDPLSDNRGLLQEKINRFMLVRQGVALRLHIDAHNWAEAYVMYHRMSLYGTPPLPEQMYDNICKLAGIVSAARDAFEFSTAPIILDPIIGGDTLKLLPADVRSRLTQASPDQQSAAEPNAYLRMDPEFPPHLRQKDGVFDIRDYVAQFV